VWALVFRDVYAELDRNCRKYRYDERIAPSVGAPHRKNPADECARLRGHVTSFATLVRTGKIAHGLLRRTAFIIRSLKHPEEVDLRRHVYGRAFYVIEKG
jgi:hypothetical protein